MVTETMNDARPICAFHVTLTRDDYKKAGLSLDNGALFEETFIAVLALVLLGILQYQIHDVEALSNLPVSMAIAIVMSFVIGRWRQVLRPRGLPTWPRTEIDVRCFPSEIEISSLDWALKLPNAAITKVRKMKSQLLITYYDTMLFVIPRRAIDDDIIEAIMALEVEEASVRVRAPFLPIPIPVDSR